MRTQTSRLYFSKLRTLWISTTAQCEMCMTRCCSPRTISRKKLALACLPQSILHHTSISQATILYPSSLMHISHIPSLPPPQPQTKKKLYKQSSRSLVAFQPAVPSPKREEQRKEREIYPIPHDSRKRPRHSQGKPR